MIKIVIGKPGTGKTYHTVRYIVKYLQVNARKEHKRQIFTNISLNLEALQKYFDDRKINVDVSEQIVILTDEDLTFNRKFLKSEEVKRELRGSKRFEVIKPFSKAFFWNRIPDRALIVVDEIQKYIGSIKEYGESERQSLVEYFSLHRHKKHDWIFLTQSLMSLSVEVRRVSEQVDELFNIKTMTLPFPLSIPVQDVFTVLRAFGVVSQVYRVRSGYLENSFKVNYEGPLEVVKMSSEIFDLYKTHTLIKEDSDLDSGGEDDLPYELGRGAWYRAFWWFTKKHAPHLLLKAGIIALCVFVVIGFVRGWQGSVNKMITGNSLSKNSDIPISKPLEILTNSEESEDIDNDLIDKVPIITTSDYIERGDHLLSVGSIDPGTGLRLKSVDPRNGASYEKSYYLYLREYNDLDRLRSWLWFVRSLDDSADDSF